MATISHYDQHGFPLVKQYKSLSFEKVHASLLDVLPVLGETILDIGAGFDRDAA